MNDKKKGARNFAQRFYKSHAWEHLSRAYRMEHPLCERCLQKGIYHPSEITHHIIHIDEDNCHDPEILYGYDNLEALCRDCHGAEHSGYTPDKFDEKGRLII